MASVIFDFDGTLADTFPLIVDVSYRLSPGTRRLPNEQIAVLRRLPLLTAVRRLGISRWYVPLLILFIRRRLTPRMQEVPACEGVLPVLHKLHKNKHRLLVLTSNYKENVEIFLKHQGVDKSFTEVATVQYASTGSKTRALKKLIKRHNLRLKDCYYVGNEALDMEAAERVGIRGVATTWGGFSQKALKKTKPFAIIDKPSELIGLLQ
jgi:phosphoglycolate phosphatase